MGRKWEERDDGADERKERRLRQQVFVSAQTEAIGEGLRGDSSGEDVLLVLPISCLPPLAILLLHSLRHVHTCSPGDANYISLPLVVTPLSQECLL